MLAKEEEGPPVQTAVEINRSDCLRKSRFVLATCCGDCLESFGNGLVEVLERFTVTLLPLMAILVLPTLACWIIGGIVGVANSDILAFHVSAHGFLAWGFSWLFAGALLVSDHQDIGMKKVNVSGDAKLVYFAYGLLRAGLSVTGIYRLNVDCVAFDFLDFEVCPTEQVIRYVGYACLFWDPYVFSAFGKWPDYYEANENQHSVTILMLKHAVFTLPWALSGFGFALAIAVIVAFWLALLPALLAVHVGPFVFYISGIIALATQDDGAVYAAIITFFVLNWSYFVIFVVLLQETEDDGDMLWMKRISDYLRALPMWTRASMFVFLLLRFLGAIAACLFYVNPSLYTLGLTFQEVSIGVHTAAIVFAVLDPLLICCMLGGPSFVQYIKAVSESHAEHPLPVSEKVIPPK